MQPLLPVHGGEHLESTGLQRVGQGAQDERVVVDDQRPARPCRDPGQDGGQLLPAILVELDLHPHPAGIPEHHGGRGTELGAPREPHVEGELRPLRQGRAGPNEGPSLRQVLHVVVGELLGVRVLETGGRPLLGLHLHRRVHRVARRDARVRLRIVDARGVGGERGRQDGREAVEGEREPGRLARCRGRLVADLDDAGAGLERAVHAWDAQEDVHHVSHGWRAHPGDEEAVRRRVPGDRGEGSAAGVHGQGGLGVGGRAPVGRRPGHAGDPGGGVGQVAGLDLQRADLAAGGPLLEHAAIVGPARGQVPGHAAGPCAPVMKPGLGLPREPAGPDDHQEGVGGRAVAQVDVLERAAQDAGQPGGQPLGGQQPVADGAFEGCGQELTFTSGHGWSSPTAADGGWQVAGRIVASRRARGDAPPRRHGGWR